MPKNVKKRKTNRPKKATTLQYADASLEQRYGRVTKELGCRQFSVELLDKQERVASLSKGVARRAGGRLKVGDLVLVQPMSDDIYGKQEVVTIYSKQFEKQLQAEGKLAIIKEEEEKKEDLGFIFEGDNTNNDERKFDENDIDIDDI